MDLLLTLPDGTDVDGAVVELRTIAVELDAADERHVHVAGEVRIPAPAVTGYEDSTSFNSSI